MEVYEIDVLESFECIGGGTDELVLWSDDSATIRHIPANERVCPVCGCELVPDMYVDGTEYITVWQCPCCGTTESI